MPHLPPALSMSNILEKGLQQGGSGWKIKIIAKLDATFKYILWCGVERILGSAIRDQDLLEGKKIIILFWMGTFLSNLNF